MSAYGGRKLGFITPLTYNFCESCNRVRVTCTGVLYMCLGQEDAADPRAPLRASEANLLLNAAIDAAIAAKPKGHDFVIERGSSLRYRAPCPRRVAELSAPARNASAPSQPFNSPPRRISVKTTSICWSLPSSLI